VLRLRKVELLGFKSFCEKTPITFSGSGITCIVGPNGCGKSNVVDAISWVLGEQSHKMLRAERMSDCIFNGTAKRPPMGLSEVTLTLVDPELSEAVAKVMAAPEDSESEPPLEPEPSSPDSDPESIAAEAIGSEPPQEIAGKKKFARKHVPEKPAMMLKPGEVVIGRRLYRSGQSEYLINGRVARLRDVQEIFMGIGLGPDSYAIIEQGRIGQILNSKPTDRRAIIEEAAGITMYKTKRRLAEAKLEASKINLARVNDIFVEVEKQLASLKRQAGKARRYAELREQMRGLLRSVLASKAEHLDIEAARLGNMLREMESAEERQSGSVHELEADQERLTARTYDLDAELRRTQNLLGQAALDLDRSENRITFNREQAAHIESRGSQLAAEVRQVEAQAAEIAARMETQRAAAAALREQTLGLESALREAADQASAGADEQRLLESRIEELRQLAARMAEESARDEAEYAQAEEAASRHSAAEAQRSAAVRGAEAECSAALERVESAERTFQIGEQRVSDSGAQVLAAKESLSTLRGSHEQTARQLETAREELSASRARHASIDQILRDRAYTADTVQKLFHSGGEAEARGFRAAGLLADYAEVQEQYESAIEQFLREELEYVVVETFDHARAGIALLREEVGGRATFFVDSLSQSSSGASDSDAGLLGREGVLARLDQLIEFRAPLGPAAKRFLSRLRDAYLVDSAALAEILAQENPAAHFLTPDGACYHGRLLSGGRSGEAGPLALKRELRRHESEVARIEQIAAGRHAELSRIALEIAAAEEHLASANASHMDAEKSLVAASHQREQARADLRRLDQQLSSEREEIARLRAQAEAAALRAVESRQRHAAALNARAAAESDGKAAAERLSALRRDCESLQERVAARREELAAVSERLAGAESAARQLVAEAGQSNERVRALRQQQDALERERTGLESACQELALQAESLRIEKARLEEQKTALETEWQESRTRAAQIEESLRGQRQSLEELRAERGQRQIEKARNDADRDYLRQTCMAELNAQPEQLMAEQSQLLTAEDLIAAETSYNEMKARAEAMGPVNMMALEEFQECEQREEFLRRERDDLVQSIQNTQLTITELDQVSRLKFEEAFAFINQQFAIAFHTLFGGGHGEMRLGEPDSSGEAGIDIVAQPPGKRLQNILLLSGGEKALTALALLIAVFRFQPSPFCILDEVDAPLDEANVGRFNRMLADMCGQTQFIVVTHNRRTMEMGSVLYGVTMQEPGVSKLVSVKWEDVAQKSEPKAASNAA